MEGRRCGVVADGGRKPSESKLLKPLHKMCDRYDMREERRKIQFTLPLMSF